MTDRPLIGHAAVVTGASSGIGRAAAESLARDGADVAVAARREDRLRSIADDLADAHGVNALAVPTDVTDPAAVTELVERTVDTFGGLDVAVPNAGIGASTPDITDLPLEEYRRVMAVNVDGMFHTARAALPHLREHDGTLVFVASFAGRYPRPGAPLYAATKWWTRGFALSLAGREGPRGVGVSVVNPTEVRTEFGDEHGASHRERYDPGEVTDPGTVGDAIAYAARQDPPDAATEIDLYRRDKFAGF